jgi:hypothetical protein
VQLDTIFEVRRSNLRRLIDDRYQGNNAALARRVGIHPNQLNLILTSNPDHRRDMRETTARRIEEMLGIPAGYLDEERYDGVAKVHVSAAAVPDQLRSVLRTDESLGGLTIYADAPGKLGLSPITGMEHLTLAVCVTRDLEPAINHGDRVLIDAAARVISSDGVYLLARDASSPAFLRRVTRLLTGGWQIDGGGETLRMDSVKALRVSGRVVLRCTLQPM